MGIVVSYIARFYINERVRMGVALSSVPNQEFAFQISTFHFQPPSSCFQCTTYFTSIAFLRLAFGPESERRPTDFDNAVACRNHVYGFERSASAPCSMH